MQSNCPFELLSEKNDLNIQVSNSTQEINELD